MSFNTIIITGDPIQKEAIGVGTITPGMVLMRTSADKVQAHNAAGQNCQKMLAIEDDAQGNDINDDYSDGDVVQFGIFGPGMDGYVLLADGESVAIGDYVESNGDGNVKKHEASSAGAVEYPEAILGVAREALDLSGSSGADPSSRRLRIEFV